MSLSSHANHSSSNDTHQRAAERRLNALCLPHWKGGVTSRGAEVASSSPSNVTSRCTASSPSPFVYAGTAFPSPFHSHALASPRSGGNAYSAPALSTPPQSQPASSLCTCGCNASEDASSSSAAGVTSAEGGASAVDAAKPTRAPEIPAVRIDAGSPVKWTLASLLEHNHSFVNTRSYVPFLTSGFPDKRVVVVTCMDTRLTELLPAALGLRNGDAKIIKVAGAMVAHPFGSVMRSILVAVYALGAQHILVVGHHDCGMTGINPKKVLAQAGQRGVSENTFRTLNASGLNLESWLGGFDSVTSGVLHSVETIKNHPLLNFKHASATAEKISVTGLVIDPRTGKLDLITPPDPDTAELLARIQK